MFNVYIEENEVFYQNYKVMDNENDERIIVLDYVTSFELFVHINIINEWNVSVVLFLIIFAVWFKRIGNG